MRRRSGESGAMGSGGLSQSCRLVYKAHEGARWLSRDEFAEQLEVACSACSWIARGGGTVAFWAGAPAPLWSGFEVVVHFPWRVDAERARFWLGIATAGWTVEVAEMCHGEQECQGWLVSALCFWIASESRPRNWFGVGLEGLGVDVQGLVEMELETPLLTPGGRFWEEQIYIWL
jgi:hypothetical protein